MSELKGQLLAMILTLAAFGTVAAILIPTFTSSANAVNKTITVDSTGKITNTQAASSKVAGAVVVI